MQLSELLNRVDTVEINAKQDLMIKGISFDSRTTVAGDIFVAVRGYENDGHQYIDDAVQKGAVCVICEEKPNVADSYVIVEDSRIALAIISAAWFGYPAENLKVIGVTGTNGKTTVSNLIKWIIEKASGKKAGLIGTNMNMIGDVELETDLTTPQSYNIHELFKIMHESGCEYAVMEVSSHALYQSRVHGIEFEVGVFTNLSPDHLDFHSSLDEYARAKAILFELSKNAVINIDDEYAQLMISKADCPIITYGVQLDTADLLAKNIRFYPDKVDFSALAIGRLDKIELAIPGMFTVYNALAAISAAMFLGIDMESIAAALKTNKGVKGRAEVVPVGQNYTVLIDYAHTPDALENIITTCKGFAKGRVVTLFGCGGDRDRTKRPIMGEIAAKYSDFVIVTSDNPRTEQAGDIINEILVGMADTKTPYNVIENRREAIHWALENSKEDDVLILAGKGHETYQILGKEKIHFDEREVVAEFYNS
ncbi:MAG: UDP-N-acetylmuramoyl-L-alanyl-D-glutamate--2,6-diaminopimelate ligase [Oscillospiraceae bacterium]|nr:UDP-N-acetylmuramoyl-L-alanyl-D-glutamate--2,6-diaminopimelate ligase [Oscillospiraceae bacterium]